MRFTRSLPFMLLPEPIQRMQRFIRRWLNAGGHITEEALGMVKVDFFCSIPQDFHVRSWMALLRTFRWTIFPIMGFPEVDPLHAAWLDGIELYSNLEADLFLLQSHISALLAGSEDANLALSRNSISFSDPMYIADPVAYVANIFTPVICRRHIPSWMFPFETGDASLCVREFFLFKWESVWNSYEESFPGIGVEAFLREALAGRSRRIPSWCSLELVVVVFVVFFEKFSRDHQIPIPVRKKILKIFLRDIVCRIAVFPVYDLIFQLGYNYLKIAGAICSALNPVEWAQERSPLVSRSVLLKSGETIHFCFSVLEEILANHLASQSINRFIFGNCVQFSYGPEGRVSNAFFSSHRAEIGGMGSSTAWAVWHSLLPTGLRAIRMRDRASPRVCSLQELSAGHIHQIFLQGSLIDPLIHASLLNQLVFADYCEGSAPLSTLLNNRRYEERLQAWQGHVQRSLLQQLQAFAQESLTGSSSEDQLMQARKALCAVLELLPFCFSRLSRCILVSSNLEWFLQHLFRRGGFCARNRACVIAAGHSALALSLWNFINQALESEDLRSMKRRFMCNFFVLYAMYFVRKSE